MEPADDYFGSVAEGKVERRVALGGEGKGQAEIAPGAQLALDTHDSGSADISAGRANNRAGIVGGALQDEGMNAGLRRVVIGQIEAVLEGKQWGGQQAPGGGCCRAGDLSGRFRHVELKGEQFRRQIAAHDGEPGLPEDAELAAKGITEAVHAQLATEGPGVSQPQNERCGSG